MLTKLRIKNFRCFEDTGELDIRPLTFLVGPNSSGKSSILKFLLMLKQTVNTTETSIPLVTNGDWIEIGAYPEFIFKGEHEREFEFELWFLGEQPFKEKLLNFKIKSKFNYDAELTKIKLIEINIDDEKINIIANLKQNDNIYNVEYFDKSKNSKLKSAQRRNKSFYNLDFLDTFLDKIDFGTQALFMSEFGIYTIDNSVEDFFEYLYFVGPLRVFPKRIYGVRGQVPENVGIQGENATDILWYSHRMKEDKVQIIKEKCLFWFDKFSFAANIIIDAFANNNYYRVLVVDPNTGFEANLADVGFGVSQTLPIIIESFYAPENSTILIEQPEIHLHPRAQLTLGDLFVEAVKESPRTFIIETHSELILARVRRNIAEKKIKKEDVAIYYFEPTKDGTKIHPVKLNDNGQYIEYPKGFFDEYLNEAFAHLEAMSKPETDD